MSGASMGPTEPDSKKASISSGDTAALRAIRAVAGIAIGTLGTAVCLGWPFEPVLEDLSLAAPGFVALGAWLLVVAAWVLAGAFSRRWGRWPAERPRSAPARIGLGTLALIVLPSVLVVGGMLLTAPTSNVGDLSFEQELAIPPLLEPERSDDGERVFDLRVQHGRRTFVPGTSTETLGVNGDYLGPTLRMRDGDQVRMDVTNAIGEVTTMHWHGMHLPAAADGGPHQLIHHGETWTAQWTVDQPAATLWYHPHPHGLTGDQIERGLAGLLIVDDDHADSLDLRSFPPDLGAPLSRRAGGADEFEVLRVVADQELRQLPALPQRLADIAPLAPAQRSPDRAFELGDEVIDGREMDMERVDHVVAADTIEVWEVTNTDVDPHNFHIHDRHFQVLSVDGVPREILGWEDTVYVAPGSTVRVAIEFGRHTDPSRPYMFHCHLLTHEDHGMMGQFTIVDPDEVSDAPRRIPAPGHHRAGRRR